MKMSKYYRKRLVAIAWIAALLAGTFCRALLRDISDDVLDAVTLALHKKSTFDPRSIAYCVYSYINKMSSELALAQNEISMGNNFGIYFHWDDWSDLTVADHLLDDVREEFPDGTCNNDLRDFGSVNPYFMELYLVKTSRSAVSLYCNKDIPKRVLAPTEKGYVEVPILGKRRLGRQSMPKRLTRKTVILEMKLGNSKSMQRQGPSSGRSPLKFMPFQKPKRVLDIDPEDFIFDVDKRIFDLKKQLNENKILGPDLQYLLLLELANMYVDVADRHFKYPWIYTDIVAGRSHHIAYPFFKRYVLTKERHAILHHMVRTWFKFAEAAGAKLWINHGSLLAWTFNGVNMPWDTDIDIQIPIAQLDSLARKFNLTLILESPVDGNARYYFEVSPTYIRQGNGRNFIDARFIDVDSGLYIDISALAYDGVAAPDDMYMGSNDMSKLKAMMVHCKHWNWNSLEELLPVRHTFFEGTSVYIPNNVLAILSREYGSDSFTTKLLYNGYRFSKAGRMWVPEGQCDGSQIIAENFKCNNRQVQDEWRIVSQASQRHLDTLVTPDYAGDYDLDELHDLPIARKDPWEYFHDISQGVVKTQDWYISA